VSVAYEWLRCDRTGSGCVPIDGAVSSTYRLTHADAGHRLGARVSATNAAGGIATAVSALTPVVVGLPKAATKPHILGEALVGKRLRAGHGAWSGRPSRYELRWLRCSRTGGKCASIKGATGKAYRLTTRDAGHRLRVRVVASNLAGSARSTSAATRVVKRA
jgi:hypothetical protein